MRLHLLGVSGPYPASGGATSGYLLEAGSSLLQFDLGSGVLSRLTALMPPESLSYAALADRELWGCDLREIDGLMARVALDIAAMQRDPGFLPEGE